MSDRRRKALEELQLRLLAVTEDPTFQECRGKQTNNIIYAKMEADAEEPSVSDAPRTGPLH